MKYLMKIKIPNPYGNELIMDPQFGDKMKNALEEVKAENAYFTSVDGCRCGFIVVDINNASQIPQVAEPFFLWLHADIDFYPVMTPQDLGQAVPYIQNAVQKWGK